MVGECAKGNNVKFSVVVPVYNVAPYLAECLESIINSVQKPQCDIECICVDDGSTDNPDIVLNAFKGKYVKRGAVLKIILQENLGVGAARNAALDVVTGDWLLFLDGDDILHPYALQRLVNIINKHGELDAVQFNLKRFDKKKKCEWAGVSHDDCKVYDIAKTFAGTPTYNFTCLVYKADMLKAIRFGKQAVGEDVLFLTRFMDEARTIGKIEDVLYGYRIRSDSAMTSIISGRKVIDKLDSIKSILHIYSMSKKCIPWAYWRMQCNALMESIPFDRKSLLPDDQDLVDREWHNCINYILEEFGQKIPIGQKLRMGAVRILPKIFVSVLCRFPHWLKTKGFHR